jgi:hypothetical protein
MAFPRGRILRRRGLTLALVLAASCAPATATLPAHRKVVDNMPDARSLDGRRAALPDGQYTCSLEDGDGHRLPSFPCVVVTSNGKVHLEKVAGSQRLRGAVTLTAAGFHFEGELFCPYGDCAQPVVAEFERADERHYVGVIHTATGLVHFDLRYRPGGPAAYSEPFEVSPASAPVRRSGGVPRSTSDLSF